MHGLHVNLKIPPLWGTLGTCTIVTTGKTSARVRLAQVEMRSFVSQVYDAWHFPLPLETAIIENRL